MADNAYNAPGHQLIMRVALVEDMPVCKTIGVE